MEDHNPQTLREAVVNKIKEGKVKMHSRAYFALQALAILLAIALITLLAVAVSSFLVFSLRISGNILLPRFGWHGVRLFLADFPWIILIIVIGLAFLLEALVRHFSYRRSYVYLFVAIFALVGVAGGLVALTSFHPALLIEARRNQLPVAGGLYRLYGDAPMPDVHRGTVGPVSGRVFILQSRDRQYVVIPDPPVSVEDVETGDRVFVLGRAANGEIHAFGVRKIGPDPFYREIFEVELK